MPLNATGIAKGQRIKAQQLLDLYNLLTGVMTDQPVTLGSSLTVLGTVSGAGQAFAASSPSTPALIARAAQSQTADIFQVQDYLQNVLFRIDSAGTLQLPKLSSGTVKKVLCDVSISADQWSNSPVGATYNTPQGWTDQTITVDEGTDSLICILQADVTEQPNVTGVFGWSVFMDNAQAGKIGRVSITATNTNNVSGGVAVINNPVAGSHTIGVRFYSSVATTGGTYLRAGSNPDQEYLRLVVLEVRG